MINLYPLKQFRFPVIAECISPDVFQGKTVNELEQLTIWEGNKENRLNELFKIEEARTENEPDNMGIAVHGDVNEVRRIGACMTFGEVVVNGDAGTHLGEEMKGGKIVVHGDCGGWAGSMLKGGTIEIHGNASDYLGAPYRGSDQGMCGGKITVYGNVGNEAGAQMKNGKIRIYGNAGQFLGFRMHGGTIYVEKNGAGRTGASMINGKIVVGGLLESVLPTLTIDDIKEEVKIEEGETVRGPFYVFLGDIAENGNGKLYVSKEKNLHLSCFEELLQRKTL